MNGEEEKERKEKAENGFPESRWSIAPCAFTSYTYTQCTNAWCLVRAPDPLFHSSAERWCMWVFEVGRTLYRHEHLSTASLKNSITLQCRKGHQCCLKSECKPVMAHWLPPSRSSSTNHRRFAVLLSLFKQKRLVLLSVDSLSSSAIWPFLLIILLAHSLPSFALFDFFRTHSIIHFFDAKVNVGSSFQCLVEVGCPGTTSFAVRCSLTWKLIKTLSTTYHCVKLFLVFPLVKKCIVFVTYL